MAVDPGGPQLSVGALSIRRVSARDSGILCCPY